MSLYTSGIQKYSLPNDSLTNQLIDSIIKATSEYTDKSFISGLDHIHDFVDDNELNEYRLSIIQKLNYNQFASKLIFSHCKEILTSILGPDIAIQKNVGLSIQMPNDSSSLLPIHSDVFSSDCSPYELVIWIPLVKCYKTKSMFYLPFDHCSSLHEYLHLLSSNNISSIDEFQSKFQNNYKFLEITPPSFALFYHSIWHGNVINCEPETRWSINLRVKGLFTPYKGKQIGDYFTIAQISDATKLSSLIDEIYYDS
ncbi:sporadic carbohydrate cluster 2OG-Fe(II) oxygenase [Synechococcus sp. A15-28]|uniref:sporadic carbohydrate cluster 2OG-Fe(II) oxygenase n=1 Tax=Synechococcus sp. A15-28 TaxID=1050638 RepID=UPI001644D7C5|nr:sporadic carbohydrate cluster 2OG-Fe(II) oxygenase [Synechococcus sp. A15-28]